MRISVLIAMALSIIIFSPRSCAASDELPRVEVKASEQDQWRAYRIDPREAGEWKYYGIAPKEARGWKDAGIEFPAWANQWKTEGFTPGETRAWIKINVYNARDFKANGFGPDEADIWIKAGVLSGLRAGEFKSFGFDAQTAALWWKERFFPLDAKELRDAGFTPKEALAWKYKKVSKYSSQVYSTAAIKAWKDAGFSLVQMRDWAEGGFKIEEAAAWTKAGFTAMDALKWRTLGINADNALAELKLGHTPDDLLARGIESSNNVYIAQFHGTAALNADSTAEIRETYVIEKRAQGNLNDGFKVEFAQDTELIDIYGNARQKRTKYNFGNITLNDKTVKYSVRSINGRKAVTIGASVDFSKPGKHTVVVNYTTDNRVLHADEHDRFYVEFAILPEAYPIRRATAVITLPQPAAAISASGLAGKYAFVEPDITGPNSISYASTMPITDKDRFSVGVSLTKGAVSPTAIKRLDYLDRELKHTLKSLAIGLIALLIAVIYYMIMWFKVGADPKPGHMVPEFTPPDNISPAVARFIRRRGRFDDTMLSASIISLAMKGCLKIQRKNSGFLLTKTRDADTGALSAEEEALLDGFFAKDGLNAAITTGSGEFKNGAKALRAALDEIHKKYFKINAKYLAPGVALSVLAFPVMFVLFELRIGANLVLTPLSAALSAYLFTRALSGWVAFFRSLRADNIVRPALLTTLMAGAIFLTRYFIMRAIDVSSMWDEQYIAGFGAIVIAYAALSTLIYAAFRSFIEAPTKACSKLMDRLTGFILFLETTETGRFSAVKAPDAIKSKRDEFLAYVVALNIDAQFQASTIKGAQWVEGKDLFSSNDLINAIRNKG